MKSNDFGKAVNTAMDAAVANAGKSRIQNPAEANPAGPGGQGGPKNETLAEHRKHCKAKKQCPFEAKIAKQMGVDPSQLDPNMEVDAGQYYDENGQSQKTGDPQGQQNGGQQGVHGGDPTLQNIKTDRTVTNLHPNAQFSKDTGMKKLLALLNSDSLSEEQKLGILQSMASAQEAALKENGAEDKENAEWEAYKQDTITQCQNGGLTPMKHTKLIDTYRKNGYTLEQTKKEIEKSMGEESAAIKAKAAKAQAKEDAKKKSAEAKAQAEKDAKEQAAKAEAENKQWKEGSDKIIKQSQELGLDPFKYLALLNKCRSHNMSYEAACKYLEGESTKEVEANKKAAAVKAAAEEDKKMAAKAKADAAAKAKEEKENAEKEETEKKAKFVSDRDAAVGTFPDAHKARATAANAALEGLGIHSFVNSVTDAPSSVQMQFPMDTVIPEASVAKLKKQVALSLGVPEDRVNVTAAPGGKAGTYGISVTKPAAETENVSFADAMADAGVQSAIGQSGNIGILLGKNDQGKLETISLEKLPHLLVAGATGQGKSVGLDTIIMSTAETNSPEHVEMYLFDPKGVELSQHKELPHVRKYVGNDPKAIESELDEQVAEMERRYEAMEHFGCKTVDQFNALVGTAGHENLPFMKKRMVVLDEFADLAKQNPNVMPRIERLAAKARACGIHLVLSTQRPDVKTLTGTLKANIPCRMAFRTASGTDSRVILDENGAENLAGRGDMLFKGPDGRLTRIKGAYCPDTERGARIAAIKAKYPKPPEPEAPPAPSSAPSNPEAGDGTGGGSQQDAGGKPKTVDLSHLNPFSAFFRAISEGWKGNKVLYNRAGFNKMSAEKWKKHVAQWQRENREPDYSEHQLSKIMPLPDAATDDHKAVFKKWCAKYNAACEDPDPMQSQLVEKQYLKWLKDAGLYSSGKPKGPNPYLV